MPKFRWLILALFGSVAFGQQDFTAPRVIIVPGVIGVNGGLPTRSWGCTVGKLMYTIVLPDHSEKWHYSKTQTFPLPQKQGQPYIWECVGSKAESHLPKDIQ